MVEVSLSARMVGPFLFVAAGLLACSGLVKIRRPASTAEALWKAGLPSGNWLVRGIGAAEMAVGIACLIRPIAVFAASLSALYVAFVGYLLRLMQAPGTHSCGCLGRRDAPPSWVHVAVDLTAAGVGALAVVVPTPGLVTVVRENGATSLLLLIAMASLGFLCYAALAYLPATLFAYRKPPAHDHRESNWERHRRADEALLAAGIGPDHPSLWGGMFQPELPAQPSVESSNAVTMEGSEK